MQKTSLKTPSTLVYKLLDRLENIPLWARILLAMFWNGFIWMLTDWPQSTPDNTLHLIQQSGAPPAANWVFRTSSHFLVFGVQAILLLFVFDSKLSKNIKWISMVLFIILCLGAMDEIHQSFVPGRQARAQDVCKDIVGAVLFLWGLFWMKSNANPMNFRRLKSQEMQAK